MSPGQRSIQSFAAGAVNAVRRRGTARFIALLHLTPALPNGDRSNGRTCPALDFHRRHHEGELAGMPGGEAGACGRASRKSGMTRADLSDIMFPPDRGIGFSASKA
jgi:hypothetical protein